MQPAIYILASKKNGTLYVGVTNNLIRRIYEHRMLNIDGFTKRYKVHTLVYYELLADMYTAISREKQIKSWSRYKKISLIESVNPNWKDLYLDITQGI
ncbi:GIY-YIG nuclease family protein [Cysteiniphilum sp. 6C5]|uniref:GIY-YIG nuclease family protein n=1 Tax=unclassified Cysteiniphilum TaxID=2610889 RepID=UPI003F867BDE